LRLVGILFPHISNISYEKAVCSHPAYGTAVHRERWYQMPW